MVLKAQIGGYDIGRGFMDAGSGINLIYTRTLRAMCISLDSLKPTDCSFHGIVPGSANYPLGKIELDVCFGNSSNYRKEKLEFKVIDWPSQYHAILGRTAFAKFMAAPHYAYLTLKISGPRGTITVQGSFEVSNTCDKEFNRLAQTFGMTAEYTRLKGETNHNVSTRRRAIPARPSFRCNSRLEENPGPPHGPKQDYLYSSKPGSHIGKHAG
jgi:hypothetical protein